MSTGGSSGLEIAIIGMAGRFPGARDVQQLWRNLRDGVESITFLKDGELEPSALDGSPRDDPAYVKAAALLDGVEEFDAAFFGLSPREAEVMDPQQRIFLECAWEALEDAGCDPERFPGRIGVWAGARTDTYLFNLFSNPAAVGGMDAFEVGLGNDLAFLTTRASHRLNLRGPAVSVHTACSTALVAVHMACQSLLSGECQAAVAGAIAVNVPQRTGYLHTPGSILSPDGHCRAFDAKAKGTLFGSGVGLVVLKRLEDALEDGDAIRAVIKGSAVNNDGAAKASFTAPSVQGQTRVIRDALAAAEVEPESISYVEAHGTGTALGDPIEVRALAKAFKGARPGSCAIGSVKTNLGHLDAAAGSASLIKTVLALQHRQIPASLHFETPNPQIDFAATPFFVNAALREWAQGAGPRRAGVSAFGVGGTNAHVVLEEAPPARVDAGAERPWEVLVLSARTPAALDRAAANLAAWLESHPALALADVAHTLQVGRQAMKHRRAYVCRNVADAVRMLRAPDPVRFAEGTQEMKDQPVAFVIGESAAVESEEPALRAEVERVAVLARGGDAAAARRFAGLYAVAQRWIAWGVTPAAIAAGGIGELVAAALAGILPVEDAVTLAAGEPKPQTASTASASVAARADGPSSSFTAAQPQTSSAAPRADGAPAKFPIASGATGALLSPEEIARAARWADVLRRPSRMDEAQRAVLADGRVALDIGTDVPLSIARLWTSGVNVAWEQLRGTGRKPRRVPLPTYPFERQRHWIPPADRSTRPAAAEPSGKQADLTDWFLVPSWRRAPALALPPDALAQPRRWLVLAPEDKLGFAVVQRLERAGQKVARALPGDVFLRDAERSYRLDPRNPSDFTTLWDDLAAQDLRPDVVLHLWTASRRSPASSLTAFHQAQDAGYYSLLHLGRAIARERDAQPLRLVVASTRLFDLDGESSALPEKATLLGPCKVLPQEHEHVSTRCADLGPTLPDPGTPAEAALVDQLLAECLAAAPAPAVAYRGARRFTQSFTPLRLEADAAPTQPLRDRGTYAITGGLGGVGLILAEHLARAHRANLALIGRTAPPDRARWEEWLASHPEADPTSRRIRRLRALEEAGAQVQLLAADVADPAQLRAALDQVEARFGPIHGVLHCAGITSGASLYRPLAEVGRAESEEQLRPKVAGTYALEEALRGRPPPDFALLFSSNAAVLGGLGYVTYAASNGFLDAFASSRARAGAPPRWISASWDPWPEETKHYQLKTSMDRYAMTPAEGAEAFRRLVAGGADGHVVVATGDFSQRLALWIQRAATGANGAAAAPAAAPKRARRGPFTAPATETEKAVAAIWSEALGVNPISATDDFFELGGHSLQATRVAGRLRSAFEVELPLAKLFEATTVAALAKLVDDAKATQEEATRREILEKLAGLSDEDIERELQKRAK
jgi:acyl transferase domain-containing protein